MGKDNQDARQSLAMQTGSGLWTVRIGDWKLISGLGSGGFSKPSRVPPTDDGPKGQLYHLSADPAETNNLYRQYPEKVAELEQELNRLRTSEVTREIK
jgi:arylsulfatase A-like enzyme